jgi:hypothetical protein
MSDRTSWQSWSLQKFFNNINWQGSATPVNLESPTDKINAKPTVWEFLTVGQFFKGCNWQGLPQFKLEKESALAATSTSTLVLPVKDFFRSIDWDGNPEIGALPKLSLTSIHAPSEAEINLKNLDQLF